MAFFIKNFISLYNGQNQSSLCRLFCCLVEAEKDFGLSVTNEQINEIMEISNSKNIEKKAKKILNDINGYYDSFKKLFSKAKILLTHEANMSFLNQNMDFILINDGFEILLQNFFSMINFLNGFLINSKDQLCLHQTELNPFELT